jgi:hypothetical protein
LGVEAIHFLSPTGDDLSDLGLWRRREEAILQIKHRLDVKTKSAVTAHEELILFCDKGKGSITGEVEGIDVDEG